jgi:hypothetical protein
MENDYFNTLKGLINTEKFYIFPQVPLSQIVEKHSQSNYKNELFRVIDFCIFDLNYYPLLCIEINDTTHLKRRRAKRDEKVEEILKSAKLPLYTIWTYEEFNVEKFKKTLKLLGIV